MPPLPWPKRRPPKNTHGPKRIPWASTKPICTQATAQTPKNPQQAAQTHDQGQAAESRALHHLECHGLLLVARNHRCRCGELDLIMAQGHTAVVVEVRSRSHTSHGGALASVTSTKQQRITRCASLWWQRHGHKHFTHLRFDVLADNGHAITDWIQNAWQIDN